MILLILITIIAVYSVIYHIRKNNIEKMHYKELSLYEFHWHKKLLESLTYDVDEPLVLNETLKQLENASSKPILNEKIHELVGSEVLTKEDGFSFKSKFLNIFPRFLDVDLLKSVGFTVSEQRLLSLEKLGLDTFQIAKEMKISESSVTMIRYRLRKKLKLPKGERILEYIETFSEKSTVELNPT